MTDIQHRPGASHSNADALSRRPCLYLPCNHWDKLESRDHLHRKQEAGTIDAVCQSVMVDDHPDIGTRTAIDLWQAQEQDKDIHPVMTWLEESVTKPCWEKVAPQSETTKAYWAQ